jgi:glycosyltransferase involved in cell wall biosynthesis
MTHTEARPAESGAAVEPSLPDVDVIIATRGSRPELLGLAVEAVRSQTYAGRIVTTLVFDQSDPDDTLADDDPRRTVRLIRNTRTPGLAGGRNSGVLATTGELVAFCDDDDEWLPTKVERQVEALQSSAAPTSVTGIVVLYQDHSVNRVPHPADLTLETLVRSRVMEAHPSTVMVRREALLGPIGLVDEEIPGSFGEDYDWIIRAARASGFAVVQEPLVKVRWGQSLFQRNWPLIIEALDYLVAKHPEFRADSRAHARILGQQAFAWAALGNRRTALRTAARTVRTHPAEKRSYLAAGVAVGLVSAGRVMDMAHRRGRGI